MIFGNNYAPSLLEPTTMTHPALICDALDDFNPFALDHDIACMADDAALVPHLLRADWRHRLPVDPEAYYAALSTTLLLAGAALVDAIRGRPYVTTRAQGNGVKGLAMCEGAVRPPQRMTADERIKAEARRNGFVGGRYVGTVGR